LTRWQTPSRKSATPLPATLKLLPAGKAADGGIPHLPPRYSPPEETASPPEAWRPRSVRNAGRRSFLLSSTDFGPAPGPSPAPCLAFYGRGLSPERQPNCLACGEQVAETGISETEQHQHFEHGTPPGLLTALWTELVTEYVPRRPGKTCLPPGPQRPSICPCCWRVMPQAWQSPPTVRHGRSCPLCSWPSG
jgi:hypothetical protein